MNKKLLLSLGVVCTLSFSGCAVVQSMFSTNDDFKTIASRALEIPEDRILVKKENVQAGVDQVKFELTDIATNDLYRCTYKAGFTGGAFDVSCQKRNADGMWEDAGIQPVKDPNKEEDESWFHMGDASRRAELGMSGGYDPSMEVKPRRARSAKSSVSGVEYAGLGESAAPKVITEQDMNAIARESTKLYDGKFKVRDEQGHSYQCSFVTVGQTQSDSVAACSKLY